MKVCGVQKAGLTLQLEQIHEDGQYYPRRLHRIVRKKLQGQ